MDKFAFYAEIVHALHEHVTQHNYTMDTIQACIDWVDYNHSIVPPLCSLDLSSSAIN